MISGGKDLWTDIELQAQRVINRALFYDSELIEIPNNNWLC